MTGSELIKSVGKSLFSDFDLQEKIIAEIYPKIYNNFLQFFDEKNTSKGIAVIGDIGVGKSVCMRVMQKIFKDTSAKFVYKRAKDITDLLDEYSLSEIKAMYGSGLSYNLYIDDIGLGSPTTNNYGNITNVIAEILLDRYEVYKSSGLKTHFSSNKPTSLDKIKYPNIITLKDMYGDRVMDRVYEMCNIYLWQGKSLRRANNYE